MGVVATTLPMNAIFHSTLKRTAGAGALALAAAVITALMPPGNAQQGAATLTYSSLFGGQGNDQGYGIALGPNGSVYVVGTTDAADRFPIPFDHWIGPGLDNQGTFIVKYDPGTRALMYATFIADCWGVAIAVGPSGSAYIAGRAEYAMQSTNAVQADYGGGDYDAFVAKVSPTGDRLVYSTFLGGSGVDLAQRIIIDDKGQATVVGLTDSTNFPTTTGVVQPQFAGGVDAFVAKVGSGGSNLLFSTYLGGTGVDYGTGLAVDPSGSVYISGTSTSTNLAAMLTPTRLGPNEFGQAFVAKLTPDAKSMEYLTFFGGDGSEIASALTVDGLGNACVFGQTSSTNFPTTGQAAQRAFVGDRNDNFLVKLDAYGSNFVFATYLGGYSEQLYGVYVYDSYWYLPSADVMLDPAGNAYVASSTRGDSMIPGVVSANEFIGDMNGFVAKVDPSGSTVDYLRFFGGEGWSSCAGLAADGEGGVYVTGGAGYAYQPPYFPVTPGAHQTTFGGGGADAFLAQISTTLPLATNDRFEDRLLLSGSRLTLQTDNSNATREPEEPQHAGNAGGKSLWWSWVAPATGYLMLTTEQSDFDTLLAVYTGTNVAALSPVANNEDETPGGRTSGVRFPVVAGTAYQIAVDGRDGASGYLYLSLTFSAPANDDFANRIPISGFPVSVTGSNIDATLEPGESLIQGDSHLNWLGSRSVWWTWTSPVTTEVEVSTAGSPFDAVLAVYTGDEFANLVAVAAPNWGYTVPSRVTFQAVAQTKYQIAVNGYYDSSGPILLSIGPAAPPANDNFANRAQLLGTLIQLTNYTSNATIEPGEPSFGRENPGGKTVWWSWTAPSNGWVSLNTAGTDFQSRLGVFTGTALTNLTLVAADDNYYGPHLRFEVASGTAYSIVVDGALQSPGGKLILNLFFYQPPKIDDHSVVWSPSGVFHFHVTGLEGRLYQIQNSIDLTNWTLASTNVFLGQDFDFVGTNISGPARLFYRATEAR